MRLANATISSYFLAYHIPLTWRRTMTTLTTEPLASLLHERLPELPANVIIVPIPTVSGHVRERGFDHMSLIARRFAKRRGLPVASVLRRITSTKQRDASRTKRIAQAKAAFECPRQLDSEKIYLLLDDVMTTGSTMRSTPRSSHSACSSPIVPPSGPPWTRTAGHSPDAPCSARPSIWRCA